MLGRKDEIMTQDEQYLDLLAIFHYVVGGLTALFACIPFIHVALGIAMLLGAFDGKDAPPRFMGWLFIVLPAVFILAGWTLAACMVAAGRKLQQRRSHIFCLVIAGIEFLLFPFGTVLGVFTIIVLVKEPVRQLFAAQSAAYGGPTTPGL